MYEARTPSDEEIETQQDTTPVTAEHLLSLEVIDMDASNASRKIQPGSCELGG